MKHAAANWREYYESRFLSPEEAAQVVKSGDQVAFTMGREAYACGLALAARLGELKGVRVFVATPGYDFGWYDPGWEEAFELTILMPTGTCQEMVDEQRGDILIHPGTFNPQLPPWIMEADVLFTEVSEPDEKGFCSFGQSLWNKKKHVRTAKLAIAEVNKNLIRTYGDNFIHVSEIDYFVEHISSGRAPAMGTLAGREPKTPEPYLKDIAGYVNELIRDGDTIQIGVGRTTEPLVRLGLLEGRRDLGYHSEATPAGIISLVREGAITGRYKTVNPGKVVVTSLGGGTREEMLWANNNPMFWLVDSEYLEDIRVIAAHDNMVSINNALALDLSGQVTAEGLGHRIMSAAGGQIPFVFGALLSHGGRSIHVLPSTARTKDGVVSRIVPALPPGTSVTIQRASAMYVVTEYGVANLWGKTLRQRAQELVAIAHPDFRAELWQEAQSLYWP